MKNSILTIAFIFAISTIFAQDLIYTLSGELNQQKTSLDSILVENLTNNSRILFDSLPQYNVYNINLSKNSLAETVGIYNSKNTTGFRVVKNIPGMFALTWLKNTPTELQLSVFNVNGQKLYEAQKKTLRPGNSISVQLGNLGVFFVRLKTPLETKSFKVIGFGNMNGFDIKFTDKGTMAHSQGVNKEDVKQLKSLVITGNEDFSFTKGDSICISVFKEDYYAIPEALRISDSKTIDFLFEEIEYLDSEFEVSYPDSVGKIDTFIMNNDTLVCEKIGGEYVFQGDIILTKEQLGISETKGAAFADLNQPWTDKKVYYTISQELAGDSRITKAIDYWNKRTSLTFIARTNQANYIEFIKDPVSYSSCLGMVGGKQIIKIADWGGSGVVAHEIGHAVGLIHEHSRKDRDQYLNIDLTNIKIGKRHIYSVLPVSLFVEDPVLKSSTKYFSIGGHIDFHSLMIYPSYSSNLAINSAKPIITKSDGSTFKAQRTYLSEEDLATVEYLYDKNKIDTIRTEYGTFTDTRDDKTYKTVKIGNQWWMAENLAYEIPGKHAPGIDAWEAGYDDWCYYDNSITNGNTYGILYQWEAAKAACPAGWHLPTNEEWQQLNDYIKNTKNREVSKHLRTTTDWHNNNNGSNYFGFSALPGGSRSYVLWGGWFESEFYSIILCGRWWSGTEGSSDGAWYVPLCHDSIFEIEFKYEWKGCGFSVRCVRD
jgi:uncharacterized protein (TIGR02145 family)